MESTESIETVRDENNTDSYSAIHIPHPAFDGDDNKLAMAAKNGDREARNALYMRQRELIAKRIYPAKRLLGRLVQAQGGAGGPLEAEDIDQEAFLIFCRLVEEWQPQRAPFVPYLAEMISWHAFCFVRSNLHYRSTRVTMRRFPIVVYEQGASSEHEPQQEGSDTSEPANGAASAVENRESWDALVEQLHEDWQRLIRMKFHEGLSSRQIAARRQCSTRTVNRSLCAALELIRKAVEEQWEAL